MRKHRECPRQRKKRSPGFCIQVPFLRIEFRLSRYLHVPRLRTSTERKGKNPLHSEVLHPIPLHQKDETASFERGLRQVRHLMGVEPGSIVASSSGCFSRVNRRICIASVVAHVSRHYRTKKRGKIRDDFFNGQVIEPQMLQPDERKLHLHRPPA